MSEKPPPKAGRKQASRRGPKQPRKRRLGRRIVEQVEAVIDREETLCQPLQDANRERFCQACMTEPTATLAAIKAGYSPQTARQQASRLLTNVDIQRRLAGLLSQSARQRILRRRDVLANASQRANAALTDVADLIGLSWPEFCDAIKNHPAARAIKRVKRKVAYDAPSKTWGPAYVEEVELFDPRGSERLLADLLGWDAPKKIELPAGVVSGVIVLPAQETVKALPMPEGVG